MIVTPKRYLTLAVAVSMIGTLPAQETSQPRQAPPGWHKFGESRTAERRELPPKLRLAAGSWITIQVNQPLSSDHNQPGDSFTGTLIQPLIADGMVIARHGQMIVGRVTEAKKAGRAKGTSRLGIEVIEISLVDGQQLPVKTQWIERKGDTSVGRDVGAIGVTTGTGAAIGAAAAGGFGAGVGALAGAAASTIGVLVTRGKATVVYPETVLTFRLESPLTVSTERSAEAFWPVSQRDYERPMLYRRSPRPAPPPPYYPGYYPPYYWGSGIYFSSGPGFFYGRGFYRRW